MPNMTYMAAIAEATREEMERDESVYLMGEDIRASVYGASAGLLEIFGEDRVIDTPLSENGFFGAAIGSSLVGQRPIVETVTSFFWVGMDQMISQAAKMRYMFGGQAKLPVTWRARMFYARGAAAWHMGRVPGGSPQEGPARATAQDSAIGEHWRGKVVLSSTGGVHRRRFARFRPATSAERSRQGRIHDRPDGRLLWPVDGHLPSIRPGFALLP